MPPKKDDKKGKRGAPSAHKEFKPEHFVRKVSFDYSLCLSCCSIL